MARGALILDRYEPLGTAGSGGFGTVQIAWDPRIQRKVAIKTIQLSELDARRAGLPGAQAVSRQPSSASYTADAWTADRWHGLQPWTEYLQEDLDGSARAPEAPVERPVPVTAMAHLPGLDEARTAAMLSDARIVTVYDFEVRDRTAYLIMEYVEGITLTRLLSDYEDYLTLDVVAAVFDAMAGALAAAHEAGVLHLDVKPDNIIVNAQGQAKMTDFGLATLADASGAGTTGGGTIGYMPLEQMRRQPLDARTDEWALASVAYEMLTGDNPFRVPKLADAEAAIEGAELVVPSLCWDDIDDQVDDVIFYALDPEPGNRYASVSDFAEELNKFLGDAEAGKRQLAAIVGDALGLGAGEEGAEDAEDEDYDDYCRDDEGEGGGAGSRKQLGSRSPRVRGERAAAPGWLRAALARALVAAAAAFLGWFAASRLYPIAPALGDDAVVMVAVVCALALAAAAALKPHIGVAVAGALAGLALIAADQAIVGAALIVVGISWGYAFHQLGGGHRRSKVLMALAACLAAVLVALPLYLQVPVDALAVPCVAALGLLACVASAA